MVRLKEAGLDQMALSLDFPTAELHDAFRGVPGAFAKTLQAAAWARELGLPVVLVQHHHAHAAARDHGNRRRRCGGSEAFHIGAAAFTYTVSDGHGGIATARVATGDRRVPGVVALGRAPGA